MVGRILRRPPTLPPPGEHALYNPLLLGVGPVHMIDVTPMIMLHHMAKVKGLCGRCNSGPRSVDFELIKMEIIMEGPDSLK